MTTLQSLDADLQEVHRLVNLTKSALVRDRLHGLLSELLQARPCSSALCSSSVRKAVRVARALPLLLVGHNNSRGGCWGRFLLKFKSQAAHCAG